MTNETMSKHLALIVDDEPDIRELLEMTLGRMNINTRSAASLEEAPPELTDGAGRGRGRGHKTSHQEGEDDQEEGDVDSDSGSEGSEEDGATGGAEA